MRYLKRQNLNRRVANDTTLYSDVSNANVYIAPIGHGSLVVPIGNTAAQPGTPVNGMIRYNSQTSEFEGYQGSKWRKFKFKESSPIIQQSLGAGDGNTTQFGPLNAAYNPTNTSSNVPGSGGQGAGQYGGQNMLVIIENVIQLFTTNYTVVQNPTTSSEVVAGTLSAQANSGATTMYFNESLTPTGASGTGATATLTFPATYVDQNSATQTRTAVPFAVGTTIVVTGVTPTAYNGSFTVTASTTSSVSYVSTATGSLLFAGNVASTTAVFTATDLVNGVVTGSASIQSNTIVTSFSSNSDTDALVSITIDKPLITSNISANTVITITEPAVLRSGYYLSFTSPVPYGKPVTALIGFDQ